MAAIVGKVRKGGSANNTEYSPLEGSREATMVIEHEILPGDAWREFSANTQQAWNEAPEREDVGHFDNIQGDVEERAGTNIMSQGWANAREVEGFLLSTTTKRGVTG
jgi:hypothetical protein